MQSRMDVSTRDWVGRLTAEAKLLGRNHTEPYSFRPFSNLTQVKACLFVRGFEDEIEKFGLGPEWQCWRTT